jgi:hypothetical protein
VKGGKQAQCRTFAACTRFVTRLQLVNHADHCGQVYHGVGLVEQVQLRLPMPREVAVPQAQRGLQAWRRLSAPEHRNDRTHLVASWAQEGRVGGEARELRSR